MIKEERLIATVHAYIPETIAFIKAYGPYERELRRTRRYIEHLGETEFLENGSKDETDYSKSLASKARAAAAAVFKLNAMSIKAYGVGFIDSDHPITDIIELQWLICSVDAILEGSPSLKTQKIS